MKPTREQFKDYIRIQNSGETNMWCVKRVVEFSNSGLTTDICLYIIEHYEELKQEYGC